MRLPPELLLHIIDCLIPSEKSPVAYSQSDPVTQTLLSWALVCKLTRTTAQRLLLKHCLYIDSRARLEAILGSIARDGLSSPHGLFLAPFPEEDLDHLDIAGQIDLLFSQICPYLTRLVIDIPLRFLYPEDDELHVRPLLRTAFERLTALEEFISIQDELYLGITEGLVEPSVWSFWPRLRRLALYDVDLSWWSFFQDAQRCQTLTHLAVIRPDGLVHQLEEKEKHLLHAWNFGSLRRVVLADAEYPVPEGDMTQTFLGRLLAVQADKGESKGSEERGGIVVDILRLGAPGDQRGYEREICQKWFSAKAISGELWH
ncbi:hypothetical protein P170DRAFT_505312 [Aspergillus steynii IBT 23096]|uniref:F-box domain-containing protein n=1 Tax=Aspergillus steynii IBT 23096 TaxID=1392250 RepID=A0A2I2GNW0_9EURO|nr:uncharacterized protein P170DRAFT_505312 [Aspergillus steynii IBT 23096]PLB54568.1 hypothetical protein P170DRAFT_505312 [Aspergillus steynii IBT 23096]